MIWKTKIRLSLDYKEKKYLQQLTYPRLEGIFSIMN